MAPGIETAGILPEATRQRSPAEPFPYAGNRRNSEQRSGLPEAPQGLVPRLHEALRDTINGEDPRSDTGRE